MGLQDNSMILYDIYLIKPIFLSVLQEVDLIFVKIIINSLIITVL